MVGTAVSVPLYNQVVHLKGSETSESQNRIDQPTREKRACADFEEDFDTVSDTYLLVDR